ncbi:hypothetical protein ACQBAU_11255 [Propionibacteriaceae bacterium Y2011]|uniref:hypothetical protein n=1 Tax=Microlunatus sp. Y2014 TaxID=3418488 RepID=UPI003B4EF4DA
MPTDQIVLLVISSVMSLGIIVAGVIVWRGSGKPQHLFNALGWGLVPIGLYLAGVVNLLWQGVRGILAWADGLLTSDTGAIGLMVLAVSLTFLVMSAVASSRRIKKASDSTRAVGQALARKLGRKDAPTTSQTTSSRTNAPAGPRPTPKATKATKPATTSTTPTTAAADRPSQSAGTAPKPRPQQSVIASDPDMDEVEQILRSRGID